MLARLTDKDGDEVWVNPIHVRSVRTATGLLGGNKGTMVMLSGDSIQGYHVFVRESPSEAAAKLNAAMPLLIDSDVAASLEDRQRHSQPPSRTS